MAKMAFFLLAIYLAIVSGYPSSNTVEITTKKNDPWTSLGDYGVNVAGRSVMVFSLETCREAYVRFLPEDQSITNDNGYKIILNRPTHNDKVYGTARACLSDPKECERGTHFPIANTCGKYRDFWIRISETGAFQFGEGCAVGVNTLYNSTKTPLSLGYVKMHSEKNAWWKFDINECPVTDAPAIEVKDTSDGVKIQTSDDKNNFKNFKTSMYGVDYSEKDVVRFQLKTCNNANIKFLPPSMSGFTKGYAVQFTDGTTGERNIVGKMCSVDWSGTLVCDDEHTSTVDDTSSCSDYQPFWFRAVNATSVEFGEGCGVGSSVLFQQSDSSPFTLDDVKVASKLIANWKFEKATCTEGEKVDGNTGEEAQHSGTELITNDDGNRKQWTKLSDMGIPLSNRNLLTFAVNSCGKLNVRFHPKTEDGIGYHIHLNQMTHDDAVFANVRACNVLEDETLDCVTGTRFPSTSTCEGYRHFWVNTTETGGFQFGEGCAVGSNIMFNSTNMGNFSFEDVSVMSEEKATWRFVPREIRTASNDQHSLSNYGFAVTDLTTFRYQVKTCKNAKVRLFPQNRVKGMTGYKLVILEEEDQAVAYVRVCTINNNLGLKCKDDVETKVIKSTCGEFQSFWVTLDKGRLRWGQSSEVGSEVIFSQRLNDDEAFNLGDVVVSTKKKGRWLFGLQGSNVDDNVQNQGDETCSAMVTDKAQDIPIVTVADDHTVKTSMYGVNYIGKSEVRFQLKTCGTTFIRFYPPQMSGYTKGYVVRFNDDIAVDESTLAGRLCYADWRGKLDCYNSSHVSSYLPCTEYRPYWFRTVDATSVEFGEGCEVGANVLFSQSDSAAFTLDAVGLVSWQTAEWQFEPKTCQDGVMEDATETPTSSTEDEGGPDPSDGGDTGTIPALDLGLPLPESETAVGEETSDKEENDEEDSPTAEETDEEDSPTAGEKTEEEHDTLEEDDRPIDDEDDVDDNGASEDFVFEDSSSSKGESNSKGKDVPEGEKQQQDSPTEDKTDKGQNDEKNKGNGGSEKDQTDEKDKGNGGSEKDQTDEKDKVNYGSDKGQTDEKNKEYGGSDKGQTDEKNKEYGATEKGKNDEKNKGNGGTDKGQNDENKENGGTDKGQTDEKDKGNGGTSKVQNDEKNKGNGGSDKDLNDENKGIEGSDKGQIDEKNKGNEVSDKDLNDENKGNEGSDKDQNDEKDKGQNDEKNKGKGGSDKDSSSNTNTEDLVETEDEEESEDKASLSSLLDDFFDNSSSSLSSSYIPVLLLALLHTAWKLALGHAA